MLNISAKITFWADIPYYTFRIFLRDIPAGFSCGIFLQNITRVDFSVDSRLCEMKFFINRKLFFSGNCKKLFSFGKFVFFLLACRFLFQASACLRNVFLAENCIWVSIKKNLTFRFGECTG